jgi:hypothetical protein
LKRVSTVERNPQAAVERQMMLASARRGVLKAASVSFLTFRGESDRFPSQDIEAEKSCYG